jgi:hypothetical protein
MTLKPEIFIFKDSQVGIRLIKLIAILLKNRSEVKKYEYFILEIYNNEKYEKNSEEFLQNRIYGDLFLRLLLIYLLF